MEPEKYEKLIEKLDEYIQSNRDIKDLLRDSIEENKNQLKKLNQGQGYLKAYKILLDEMGSIQTYRVMIYAAVIGIATVLANVIHWVPIARIIDGTWIGERVSVDTLNFCIILGVIIVGLPWAYYFSYQSWILSKKNMITTLTNIERDYLNV